VGTSKDVRGENIVNANPVITKSGNAGGAVFNAIVAIVRNRTGWNYQTVFNKVLADNADLMGASIDATEHGAPFFQLLNRTQSATGLSATASIYRAEGKIAKLTNRYFPSLRSAPTCWQWDVLERTALLLEKCGIPQRLFNRASGPEVSKTDWKAALGQADDYLDMLDYQAAASKDIGTYENFRNMSPRAKLSCFSGQIGRLMKDENLSLREAFAKLKDTQPIFWAASLLSFEQEKQ